MARCTTGHHREVLFLHPDDPVVAEDPALTIDERESVACVCHRGQGIDRGEVRAQFGHQQTGEADIVSTRADELGRVARVVSLAGRMPPFSRASAARLARMASAPQMASAAVGGPDPADAGGGAIGISGDWFETEPWFISEWSMPEWSMVA